MKKTSRFTLAILSSILLTLPWYQQFSGIIILVAFVPLLFIEDYIYKTQKINKSIILFAYAALSFSIWNTLTTYWIHNATLFGAISAVIINTLLMTSTFWLFHFTKKKLGTKIGQISLLVYWIGFEHLYLNAEISWPWLNLGNAFAKDIKLIQWYEFTGTLGGTFWIILVNILLLNLLKSFINLRKYKPLLSQISILAALIFIPIIISIFIFRNYQEDGDDYNIAVLQPNIDPYNDKFGGLSHSQQLNILLNLADSITDENTDYVVGPETVLGNSIWINNLEANYSIQAVRNFVNNNPNVNFITGIDCYKRYMPEEEHSPTTRYWEKEKFYYDAYNSAIQIDTSNFIPIYHKSKLVVGVEKMPYPKLFKLLNNVIVNLGGTTGSRGTQKYRGTFKHSVDEMRIAPVICYESIYGEFVTNYIKNGANFIFVVTNDGWWGNSAGYKQHLNYSQLRAIETRRSVARSANTGISGFINQRGEILNRTQWWVRDAIKGTIKANSKLTFYVIYGDYIGRIASFLAIFIFLYAIVQNILNKSIIKRKED
ncbi:MAG: apolipoprotein N-acyltransferase [Bacteroidales bacterium]|jgi:apolipoprotein N-acyltransferase|nr:apolipoprotein N-acyltransferase [Bacteroidales bacterium]